MLLEPTPVKSVGHPFVSSAYIVRSFDASGSIRNILVIQPVPTAGQAESQDLYTDFLAHLDLISDRIEDEVDHIDRVDIRFH